MKTKIVSNLAIIIIITIVLYAILGFITFTFMPKKQDTVIVKYDTVHIDRTQCKMKNLSIERFKMIVGAIESNDNYKAISKNHKYFGLYQISEINIALSGYDVELFMSDNNVQEYVMDDLIYEYLYQSALYINKYSGTKIFDLDIDLWTILYANHCIGYSKTKKWLDKPRKNRLYYQLINFNKKRDEN